jgi:hypothetical protein
MSPKVEVESFERATQTVSQSEYRLVDELQQVPSHNQQSSTQDTKCPSRAVAGLLPPSPPRFDGLDQKEQRDGSSTPTEL